MRERDSFERLVVPHLDAAYNLARWLLRSESAAEDAVQEASMRAFRFIGSLRGEDARPWLLGIVRNTCFSMLERSRATPQAVDFDETQFDAALGAADGAEPSERLQRERERLRVDAAIRALSPPLREVVVLREFEDLEYSAIARIAGVPVGTVMSRLSRAREKLRAILSQPSLGESA